MTTTPSTDPTTVPRFTVRAPEDLVALAPIVLGFTPTDSVVLEGILGSRHFHARVDLPDRRDLDRATGDELADALVAPAREQGVRGAALLFYTDDPGAADRAWRALRRHCARSGVEVLDALRVVPGRYHPLLGERRLRESGVPVDLASHRFTVEAVARGMVLRGSRDELAATLQPDEAARDAVAVRLAAAQDEGTDVTGPAAVEWARGLIGDHVADRTRPDPDDLADLLAVLESSPLGSQVVTLIGPRDAERHIDFWTDVVRRAPALRSATPAALLAWAAWRAGHGALAWIAVDRCREVDPEHPCAAVVAHCLEEAWPPEFADELADSLAAGRAR